MMARARPFRLPAVFAKIKGEGGYIYIIYHVDIPTKW